MQSKPSLPEGANPGAVMALSTAYWGSQVLFTANRLGLFDQVAAGATSLEEISRAIDTHPRPTRLLLDACVSLNLLAKTRGRYANTPTSSGVLVKGSAAYLGDAIRYSDDLYQTWGKLEQGLRENRQQLSHSEYLGQDLERTRHFVYGMHDRALGIGNTLIHLVDLSKQRKLLDVGGGPGTYSALFTRKYPGLQSTVIDLPPIAAIAEEIVSDMGCKDSVSFLPGDYKVTEFPSGNDTVLISGVFHRESEEQCRSFIHRARQSLEPGGMLVIVDVFTDQGRCGPEFATLFGLNMMLTATDGGVHSDAEVGTWMRDEGFEQVDNLHFPPPMPHRIVRGVLPQ